MYYISATEHLQEHKILHKITIKEHMHTSRKKKKIKKKFIFKLQNNFQEMQRNTTTLFSFPEFFWCPYSYSAKYFFSFWKHFLDTSFSCIWDFLVPLSSQVLLPQVFDLSCAFTHKERILLKKDSKVKRSLNFSS